VNTQRAVGVVVGITASLATASCVVLLVAGPGSGTWTAAAVVAGLTCLVHARLLTLGRAYELERVVWRTAAASAVVVALGLFAEAGVRIAVREGSLGSAWEGAGFGVAAIVFCSLFFRGLLHWNQFRADDNDAGDWLNAVAYVLATVAAIGLVLRVVDAPMAAWSAARVDIWLAHVMTLQMLAGTAWLAGSLGGRAHDRRVQLVTGVIAASTAVQLGLGFVGAELVNLSILVVWVLIVSALGVFSLIPPAPIRPPSETSHAQVTGSLGVLGICVVVLALNTTLGDGLLTTTVLAVLAAFGSGVRLLQLEASQAELSLRRREARTDDLTGLANRRALKAAIRSANDVGDDAALLIIDLDRFKEVNDHHGHTVGDEVLNVVALRLKTALPGRALLSRLGGDEFAVLLRSATADEAAELAARLVDACAHRVPTSAGPITVGASIGIATAEFGGHRDGELLRRADTAMYVAKRAGGGISSYDRAADLRARTEREHLEDLRVLLRPDAVARCQREIAVHFQPQLDTRSGAVVGAESLVRWQHPEHGLLAPVSFLDIVERHGLMADLTAVVLRQACAEAVRWGSIGHPLRLSVNLSTSSLGHPDLLPTVDSALADSGLDPSRLVLEITETTLMSDPQGALRVTRAIAERGIGISIDDFGTGYSSLAYLHDLPVIELKLDRSFTSRVAREKRTARIVASTVDLSHGLGLRVVAEGVEDEGTLHVLTELGCDETQGYLHARPMPAEDFLSWLGERDLVDAPATAAEGPPQVRRRDGAQERREHPGRVPAEGLEVPTP
jgi:diguanylate cyclase (GGDEF)-like protein